MIIFFLPSNDFGENDYSNWKGSKRYRPYYKKNGDNNYEIFIPTYAIKNHKSETKKIKKIFKDYHNACSNYYESIKNGSVEKIEGIEKVRRKIHDDGAKDLSSILNKDFIIDENTSRRLFTLMYSLYI